MCLPSGFELFALGVTLAVGNHMEMPPSVLCFSAWAFRGVTGPRAAGELWSGGRVHPPGPWRPPSSGAWAGLPGGECGLMGPSPTGLEDDFENKLTKSKPWTVLLGSQDGGPSAW